MTARWEEAHQAALWRASSEDQHVIVEWNSECCFVRRVAPFKLVWKGSIRLTDVAIGGRHV